MAGKNRELKKLSRRELLELLIEQGREIDELRESLDNAEKKLADRSIKLNKAGTVAEAAFMLNNVYEATEAAASQYLENIKTLSSSYESECERMIAEAKAQAEKIVADAEKQKKLTIEAADEYWMRMKKSLSGDGTEKQNSDSLKGIRPEAID